MTEINTLLELRTRIKEKKPEFVRQDNPKRKKLNYKWRKPKGIHSKIRHHFKGRRKMPSPGYKSPQKARGLHASGLKIMRVFSVDGITKIKKESEGVIISKNIGAKKRFEMLKKTKELNISVLNLNVEQEIKRIEDFINSKKKNWTKTQSSKTSSLSDDKETKKEESKDLKEKETEKLNEEDKKEVEKKEKDKLLTKKI